jgi:hypothetical protein
LLGHLDKKSQLMTIPDGMKSRKSFLLRISPALYEALEAWAQQELRSVNGQIEYLLQDAVRRRGRDVTGDEPSKRDKKRPPEPS